MNPSLFEEIRMMGSKKVVRKVEAKLFPEKNLVKDLVMNYKEFAEEITGEEYEEARHGL